MPTESMLNNTLLDCLLFVCNHYERSMSSETLLAGLPLENKRLNPTQFARAAKRAGLASKIVNKHFSQANPSLLPVILLLKDNQACLLNALDLEQKRALITFPELDNKTTELSFEELEQSFSGKIIYCRPEFKFNQTAPSLTSRKLGHWFWSVIQENHRVYRDVIIAAILINLFAIAMPLFVMNVYDRVVPNHAEETLWVLVSGITLIILLDLTLKLMRSWFIDLAASRADVKLSASIMQRILGMQLKDRPSSTGSFASTIQSFESIRSFTSSLTLISLVDLPFVALFLIIIALINPILIIPILIGGVIIIIIAMSMQTKVKQLSEESMRASAMRNGSLIESLSNIESVKCLRTENKAQLNWEDSTIFLTSTGAKMRFISASVNNSAQAIQHLTAISIIIIGVYMIIEGQMSQGGLIAAYLLSSRALAPISQTAGLINQYNNAAQALESLNSIMERPIERPDDKQWLEPEEIQGAIEFKNVTFRYHEDEQYALNKVSFSIKPGEHLAIIGRNGSGKSTMQKLILALYELEEGSILIDGLDIKQIDPSLLRSQIGYIPQDVSLFFGTLKDNIIAAKPHATDQDLINAIKIAGLESFINNHPNGINMQVGERGQLLSGGQKQAIALARAVINDPAILLLDEPTASLDHTTEETIMDNIAQFAKNKTVIMVTHRTSLLKLAEKIIVIDNGRLVANGPKAQVIEALRQGKIGASN